MDVFLSYNRRDSAHAAALNTWFGGQGVATFFDLGAGQLWLPDLERRIEQDAQTIAVLIGPGGLGNTQQYEYQLALKRRSDLESRAQTGLPGGGGDGTRDHVVAQSGAAAKGSVDLTGCPDLTRHRDARRVIQQPDAKGLQIRCGHYIITAILIEFAMPTTVTINRPDVITMIETAANRLTRGNKTEAIALGMQRLLEQNARAGSLFAAHPGSVRIRDGVDLTAPILDDAVDAETGDELDR